MDTERKPDEMAIDIPTRNGTLLRFTMRRDTADLFTEDSEVEVQQHTPHGLRPLATYKASAIRQASVWVPRRTCELTLSDQDPGLTVQSHWLTALTDWTMMAADTDLDTWSRAR